MSEVKKCPKCGGEVEKGVIQFPLRDVVFWNANDVEEKLVSQYWQVHDFLAWRCKKCKLAVFLYGENKGVKP
jgi:predicted nucleic-acid-binding Zn-ribbon protein